LADKVSSHLFVTKMGLDLLTLAVMAHGGLDRWEQFTSVKASISVGGALSTVKQSAYYQSIAHWGCDCSALTSMQPS
jgi:hypothetical protein